MAYKLTYVTALVLVALLPGSQDRPHPPKDSPAYTNDGDLIAPTHYREWIYLTSGIDMSYAASTAAPDHSMFDNVFVNPTSYRSFVANGTWPDKTTLVLEVRGAENPISINKRGHTQSQELMGMEIHVKDNGEWKFYDLSEDRTIAKLIKRPASCYTCHEAHGAVDTTFVQFYPTLLPLATMRHTLSSGYLQDAQHTTSPSVPPKTQ